MDNVWRFALAFILSTLVLDSVANHKAIMRIDGEINAAKAEAAAESARLVAVHVPNAGGAVYAVPISPTPSPQRKPGYQEPPSPFDAKPLPPPQESGAQWFPGPPEGRHWRHRAA